MPCAPTKPPRPHRHLIINQFRGVTMFSRMRSLGLAAVVSALVATPALAGPPWISIELPANPYDQATRGAFLLVHAFHHGEPIGYLVTGTAEGIVGGERRSIIPLGGPHPFMPGPLRVLTPFIPSPSGRGETYYHRRAPSPEGRGGQGVRTHPEMGSRSDNSSFYY